MAKRNDGQTRVIKKTLERIDWAWAELCDCKKELEDCGCQAQVKKLDTINGKLGNLMNDLYDITKE